MNTFFTQNFTLLLLKYFLIYNSPVTISKKDHIFEIEKALIFTYLLFNTNSLKIVYPFQNESYTISKKIKIMFVFLRNYIFSFSNRWFFFIGNTNISLITFEIFFPQGKRERIKKKHIFDLSRNNSFNANEQSKIFFSRVK